MHGWFYQAYISDCSDDSSRAKNMGLLGVAFGVACEFPFDLAPPPAPLSVRLRSFFLGGGVPSCPEHSLDWPGIET